MDNQYKKDALAQMVTDRIIVNTVFKDYISYCGSNLTDLYTKITEYMDLEKEQNEITYRLLKREPILTYDTVNEVIKLYNRTATEYMYNLTMDIFSPTILKDVVVKDIITTTLLANILSPRYVKLQNNKINKMVGIIDSSEMYDYTVMQFETYMRNGNYRKAYNIIREYVNREFKSLIPPSHLHQTIFYNNILEIKD